MAKKKLTQAQLVMRHLINRGSITQAQALSLYGIGRLAARIEEIRYDLGWRPGWVETQMVRHKTKQGRPGQHALYVFDDAGFGKKYHRERWGL